MSSRTLTTISGNNNLGSNIEVRISFTSTQIIPAGGYIEINFPSDIVASASFGDYCFTGTNIVHHATSPLECYKSTSTKYLLRGYAQIAASTALTISFYTLVSIVNAAATIPDIRLYATSSSVDRILTSGTFPSIVTTNLPTITLYTLTQSSTPKYVYASEWAPV